MFSDVLLAQPLIKEKFNEALDIMNRAVSSGMGMYALHCFSRKNTALFSLCVLKQTSFYGFLILRSPHSLSPQVDICNPVQGRTLRT